MYKEYPMKKLTLLLILFPLFLGSCGKEKNTNNVSVLENSSSLINQWFGEDHYKEDNIAKKKPCGSDEDSPPLVETPGGLVSSLDEVLPAASSTSQEDQPCFSQYLFTQNSLKLSDQEEETN